MITDARTIAGIPVLGHAGASLRFQTATGCEPAERNESTLPITSHGNALAAGIR